MVKIDVPQLNKTLQANKGGNLMKFLQASGAPVASSCLGDGVCGKCVINIEFEQSSPKPTDLDLKLIQKNNWLKSQRASCQITIEQDMIVRSTYW